MLIGKFCEIAMISKLSAPGGEWRKALRAWPHFIEKFKV